ncbi:MAG: alpha/beta fold hydrolase [Pseudomonadota bacterium]
MLKTTTEGTAYEVHGPEEAPVVVLIHGLGLSRGLWGPHLETLARPYRVLAYDLLGHGDSKPASGTISLSSFSDQLLRLLDELGIARAALIGFSIGGMINRRFATDHPDRVSSLIILNSPHDRGAEAQKLVEERAAKVRDEGRMATMESALERWFTPEFRAAHPAWLETVRTWRAQADPESYAQAAWVLAHGVRELIQPQPQISAPSLVMTCENDSGSTPDMSRAIAAEIDGASLHIVPRLKHLGLLEDPYAFTTPTLGFLERTAE